jgi:hypothetical protein
MVKSVRNFLVAFALLIAIAFPATSHALGVPFGARVTSPPIRCDGFSGYVVNAVSVFGRPINLIFGPGSRAFLYHLEGPAVPRIWALGTGVPNVTTCGLKGIRIDAAPGVGTSP